jgi:hypothetical protein
MPEGQMALSQETKTARFASGLFYFLCVMAAVKVFPETRLKLQVNAAKSACSSLWKSNFLGYTLTKAGGRTGSRLQRKVWLA